MMSNAALTGLAKELEARAKSGKPIRIGLIGSGEMGTDIVAQVSLMSGIEVAAIADVRELVLRVRCVQVWGLECHYADL